MSKMHTSAFEGDANVVRGRVDLGEDPNALDEVSYGTNLLGITTRNPRRETQDTL